MGLPVGGEGDQSKGNSLVFSGQRWWEQGYPFVCPRAATRGCVTW